METWKSVWEKVFELLPGRACTTHQVRLQQMMKEANASASNIPQMEDVSNYLKSNPYLIIHQYKYCYIC